MRAFKVIETDRAPKPVAPYSQGIMVDQFLFTCGNVGAFPETGKLAGNDIESQTEQTLKNIESIVIASGMKVTDIVKITVYLKKLSDYQGMNLAYSKFFSGQKPARTTIGVSDLLLGALVEMDAIVIRR